jgi:hypothetical protein
MAAPHRARKTFAVPVTSGNYAPEEILFGPTSSSLAPASIVGLTVLLETLGAATGASLEIWLLRVDGDPEVAADWLLYDSSLSAVGGETIALASVSGVKIRAKSAGTAGSVVVSAWAD